MESNFNRLRRVQSTFRDHSAELGVFKRRAVISFIVIVALMSILVANLYHLQVTRYDTYQTRSNHNRIRFVPIPPARGMIYDRNGLELATNRTFYQLEVLPRRIKNIDKFFEELKSLISLTDEEIETFHKEKKKYRQYAPVPVKNSLTEEEIARFSVNQHRFPDFDIKSYQRRYYPYHASASHAMGYVSKINDKDIKWLTEQEVYQNYSATKDIGKQGVERYYEHILHGKPGYEQVEVNSRGRIIRQLNEEPPQAGQNLHLTLDIKLQLYIESLLANRKASVIVSDPRDGSILALVSTPSYDPNSFVNGISNTDYTLLREDEKRPLFNRATLGTYPPASTVKQYIGAAALQEKVITSATSISDPGWWRLPTNKNKGPCTIADLKQGCFRDWNRWGRKEPVNLLQAIEFSSDTFFYHVAFNMGIDRLSYWMKEFGYGLRTGIDITEEATGLMPSRDWKQRRHKQPWYQGDTISVGIGQGYWIASPIQMNKALVTLINNGKIKTPHLLLATESNSEKSPYVDPQILQSSALENIPNTHWVLVKQGMYNVVHGRLGSARKAFQNSRYLAAGKSGTAQVFGLNKGNYNAAELPENLHDHALYVAYAPFDNPSVAINIIIENGGGGGKTAAPIARKILDYILLGETSSDNIITD